MCSSKLLAGSRRPYPFRVMLFLASACCCSTRGILTAIGLRRCLVVMVLYTFSFSAQSLRSQTCNGGGGDNLWTDGTNWGGSAPVNNGTAAVIFGGTTRLTPDMNASWNIASLTFNSSAGAFTLASTGSFTLTIQGGGITNNSTNAETINNAITLGAAQTWNATSGNLVFGGNINNGNQTLTIGGANNTSIGGIMSGNGGLTKNGAGTLTLTGANTYAAVTTINAGAVNIQNNTAFGAANQSVTVASGAAIQIQNGLTGVANNITISGNGISNDGALRNISGSNTVSGAITLNANSYIGADAGTLTLSGNIGGGGSGLTIVGNGTVAFSGAGDNNYTGTTEVKSGTLLLSKGAGHKAMAGPRRRYRGPRPGTARPVNWPWSRLHSMEPAISI